MTLAVSEEADVENPLKAWRLKQKPRRVSIRKAAARLGVSDQAVQAWENGSSTPRDERWDRIAALLQVDATYLRRRWTLWLNGLVMKS